MSSTSGGEEGTRGGPASRQPSTASVEVELPPVEAQVSTSNLSQHSQQQDSGEGHARPRRGSSYSQSVPQIIHSTQAHEQTAQEAMQAIHSLEEDTPWHTLTSRECCRAVGMRYPERGLQHDEVHTRRTLLGNNTLDEGKTRSLWAIIIPQFVNWMTGILFAVLVLSLVLSEYIEAVVVILVILLNGSIGAWQEVRSEQSMSAIRDLARGTARVRREGVVRTIDITEVVVGDIIEFREGDQVPADVRLMEASRLEVDEAALTGESVPVHKTTSKLEDPEGTMAIGDRTNMAFRQTWVSVGHGTGVVIAVGSSTQIGKVAERLATTSGGSTKTPLMREMDMLMLVLFCTGLIFAVFILWAFRWQVDSSSLLYASATLVAILPEIAIVLLSVVMALGSRRMAEQRAIVRRLSALERLGKVTDICSDKTGTLTAGKMVAVRVWISSEMGISNLQGHVETGELAAPPLVAAGGPMRSLGKWHREESNEPVVESVAQGPIFQDEGDSEDEDEDEDERGSQSAGGYSVVGAGGGSGLAPPVVTERPNPPSPAQQAVLRQEWTLAMMATSLCSSTFVEASEGGTLTGTGNPTELALQVLSHQAALPREAFLVDWEARGEWSFDSTAKRMSTGWRHRDLPVGLIITKGAPERVLTICSNLTPDERSRIEEGASHLARQGLRVLALGYRVVRNGEHTEATPLSGSSGASGSSSAHQEQGGRSRSGSRHRSNSSVGRGGKRARSSSLARVMDAAHAQRSVESREEAVQAVRELNKSPVICAFLSSLDASDDKPEIVEARHIDLDVDELAGTEGAVGDDDEIIDLREQLVGDYDREMVERDLIFIGLVGLRDPPKPESAPAVRECGEAGIRVRMLTGDHRETAVAIAEEIGILRTEFLPEGGAANGDEEEGVDRWHHLVMTGPQMDQMSVEDMDQLPELPLVVARCTPETKVRMVEALHRRSAVVAMTGDGVNDSPAIKSADVGIAMGMTGSELTKSVSDMVLADDNFATIVSAVREGRRMFNSISKFVLHLLCGNMSEAVTLMLSLAFVTDNNSLPVFVLAPLAILWLNTLTGTGPALGISMDPTPPDMMKRPPLQDTLFTWELIQDMFAYGVTMGALTLGAFSIVVWGDGGGQLGRNCNTLDGGESNCGVVLRGRAAAFAVLNILLLTHAFNCRHERFSAFSLSWVKNRVLLWSLVIGLVFTVILIYIPFINVKVFKHENISWEWGVVVGAVIIFHGVSELYKWFKRIRWDRQQAKERAALKAEHKAAKQKDLTLPGDKNEQQNHV